jgi:hypothetical protein
MFAPIAERSFKSKRHHGGAFNLRREPLQSLPQSRRAEIMRLAALDNGKARWSSCEQCNVAQGFRHRLNREKVG